VSGTGAIRASLGDGLLRLTLSRPDRMNTIDFDFAADLNEGVDLAMDPSVRVLLIDAEGPAFCAGGDLARFERFFAEPGAGEIARLLTSLHAAIARLALLDIPVVAAVQGVAAGAGLSLVAACDIVVASSSARFTLAYTKAGLTLDGASTYFLPRIIGLRRATELALTNRVLTATEALEWGLTTAVVDADELPERALRTALDLRDGATGALGATKRLLRTSAGATLTDQLGAEEAAMIARFSTADAAEGIHAFIERRAPKFTGD